MVLPLGKRGMLNMVLAVCVTVVVHPALAAELGQCPQPRFTGKAPQEYLARTNPVAPTEANLSAAEELFQGRQRSVNCAICHGKSGDGKGPLASQFDPPPRNFACARTIEGVPDGQLFWIIRFGSPETAMPAHARLKDEQVWQLVAYLRQIAKR